MMKRFNVDWKTLEQDLETHDWEEVEFMLKKKRLGTVIPREEDLHGAAQALIRLQDVYELDIRDLSKGKNFTKVAHGQINNFHSFLKIAFSSIAI